MENLKEYLLDNIDELKDVVGEINSWNGALEYLDYWENDEEFFNTMFGNNTIEAVRATQFGNYNYMDEYVHFNAYGNLDSCSEWEYEEELKSYIDEIVDNLIELQDRLHLSSEIEDLINNIEEEEE